MVEMKGKPYPVQFMHFKDKSSTSNNSKHVGKQGKVTKSSRENGDGKGLVERKRQLELEEDIGQLRDKTNVPNVLARAKSSKVSHLKFSRGVLQAISRGVCI